MLYCCLLASNVPEKPAVSIYWSILVHHESFFLLSSRSSLWLWCVSISSHSSWMKFSRILGYVSVIHPFGKFSVMSFSVSLSPSFLGIPVTCMLVCLTDSHIFLWFHYFCHPCFCSSDHIISIDLSVTDCFTSSNIPVKSSSGFFIWVIILLSGSFKTVLQFPRLVTFLPFTTGCTCGLDDVITLQGVFVTLSQTSSLDVPFSITPERMKLWVHTHCQGYIQLLTLAS